MQSVDSMSCNPFCCSSSTIRSVQYRIGLEHPFAEALANQPWANHDEKSSASYLIMRMHRKARGMGWNGPAWSCSGGCGDCDGGGSRCWVWLGLNSERSLRAVTNLSRKEHLSWVLNTTTHIHNMSSFPVVVQVPCIHVAHTTWHYIYKYWHLMCRVHL